MIPAGYMAKRVARRPFPPNWIWTERVEDVYSISPCLSKDFAPYIDFWKHNGYWFFDSPQIIRQVAQENGIDLNGTTLFYYEMYEQEFVDWSQPSLTIPESARCDKTEWRPIHREDFPTDVMSPKEQTFEGYDIVGYFAGSTAECSPLSCSDLADEVEVNRHCLLDSLEKTIELMESGALKNAEPGPYRVFAVYSVEWSN